MNVSIKSTIVVVGNVSSDKIIKDITSYVKKLSKKHGKDVVIELETLVDVEPKTYDNGEIVNISHSKELLTENV